MLYIIISILVITGVVWLVNKLSSLKICPVCAGVSGTWIVLSVLILTGVLHHPSDMLRLAILMGGTVVGIAYQGEKKLRWANDNPIFWKLIVVGLGFPAVYAAVQYLSWATLTAEFVVLGVLMYAFFIRKGRPPESHLPHRTDVPNVQKIEKGLEKCC